MQSAVRLSTPPPPDPSAPPRKRSLSRSPSPVRRVREFPLSDVNPNSRQLPSRPPQNGAPAPPAKPKTDEEKQEIAKAEYEKLLNVRSGGTYIPPARLRALQAQITDRTSPQWQRLQWEALKKSINGLVNKVNVSNIKHIVPELFQENLIRGRGMFCRSLMKAQSLSLPYTPIFAALTSVINCKLPSIGELLLKRLVSQWRRALKRNDKAVCLSAATFIAHLVNYQVCHETLVAMMLLTLLNNPTDDSCEVAVGLLKEVGRFLEEFNAPIATAVFDQLRAILHDSDIDIRVQYMIEVMFEVRKSWREHPIIKEGLDLVEEEDLICHRVGLEDHIDVEDGLNVFKFDPNWQENQDTYEALKAEILNEGSGEDESESGESSSDDQDFQEQEAMDIKDQTNTSLVNLRRTIYLTVMSAVSFEEAAHKLMKVDLPAGKEPELPSMIIEMASMEKSFSSFHANLAERFCRINRLWKELFESSFDQHFSTIHRYETNKLRNIARLFGHLLSSDAIGWHVLGSIKLNEEETTSSSRIFIKILFQSLAEAMGIKALQSRLKDDILRPSFEGIFPKDEPRNTRFSINYFTSIGMGGLTEEMREYLENAPKLAPIMPVPAKAASRSRSSSLLALSVQVQISTPSEWRHERAPWAFAIPLDNASATEWPPTSTLTLILPISLAPTEEDEWKTEIKF